MLRSADYLSQLLIHRVTYHLVNIMYMTRIIFRNISCFPCVARWEERHIKIVNGIVFLSLSFSSWAVNNPHYDGGFRAAVTISLVRSRQQVIINARKEKGSKTFRACSFASDLYPFGTDGDILCVSIICAHSSDYIYRRNFLEKKYNLPDYI